MNKIVKLIIAGLMIAVGIWMMFFTRELGWGIVITILSAIPIFLYFKNEYILLCFWQFRKQNMEKAGEWLSKITDFRKQLHKSQYGYYHYLKGLALAQESPTKMEGYMKEALNYGLNMKQDRAMATLNLAAAALSRGSRQEGKRLLDEAKALDTSDMLGDQIKMLKNQLKSPNMQKHMHNPYMRNRGKF